MIVILKRDDLLPEHRHQTVQTVEVDHSGLSSELIEKAELIVFVEGVNIKFLKHLQGIQSSESLDVFLKYITTEPKNELPLIRVKRTRRKKTN
jgi:hypothetical protein